MSLVKGLIGLMVSVFLVIILAFVSTMIVDVFGNTMLDIMDDRGTQIDTTSTLAALAFTIRVIIPGTILFTGILYFFACAFRREPTDRGEYYS